MTTVINTPPSGGESDSGFGFVLGVILAIALVALFFVYALPALREDKPDNSIIIPLPTGSSDNSNNSGGGGSGY